MEISTTKICDGLGVGEGSISGNAIANAAGTSVMGRVEAVIASPEILVAVSRDDDGRLIDDDGCGDGRIAKVVMRGHEILHRSLHRAKVFGGGCTMTVADLIGSDDTDDTLLATFNDAINILAERMINFGAHTADQVPTPDKCGCGAIDGAAEAITWAVSHRDAITQQFEMLGVLTDGLGEVLDNFEKFASKTAGQTFHGADVMELIVSRGKIVKQLSGVHVEACIILNYVKEQTLDQGRIHSVSDGNVDIFGVDVWRMQELAKDLHPEDERAEFRAFQSMLVYTLAVAAILTKGDLPVYAVMSTS